MHRPVISDYKDPVAFIQDMISFRKTTEEGFSVRAATQPLRRVSPALVSLVLKRKRAITLDRADEFARLLALNTTEKFYFRNWLQGNEAPQVAALSAPIRNRKDVGAGLLTDWINVYVKDLFQIPAVQKNPELLKQQLLHIASPKRIERALQFLLREGYLRRTLDQRVVPETRLAVAETPVPNRKIREMHKGALGLAKRAIDVFASNERLANTLIIPLDEKGYEELQELIQEFAEKLKDFAAGHEGQGDRLYQLIVNVSPVGGKLK